MTTEQYTAWLIETCAKPAAERDTLLELEGPWDLRRGVIGLAAELDAAVKRLAKYCGVRADGSTPCLCYLEEKGRKCGYCDDRAFLARHEERR